MGAAELLLGNHNRFYYYYYFDRVYSIFYSAYFSHIVHVFLLTDALSQLWKYCCLRYRLYIVK